MIDEDRVAMNLGWRHTSGFSVHNEVVVQADDGDGLERLARYLARPPVSLQRMEWDRETGEKVYRTGRGHAEERGENLDDDVERIDELEFLARVVTQLPEPRKHSIRYYGYYAAVVRANDGGQWPRPRRRWPRAETTPSATLHVTRAATDAIHQLSANYYDAQKDLRALGLPQSAREKLARLLLEWVEYAGEALRVRDLAALRRIARE